MPVKVSQNTGKVNRNLLTKSEYMVQYKCQGGPMDGKKLAKQTAKTLLTLSLLATYIAKYGVNFSADMSKTVLNAGTKMTDYFLDNKVPKLGIGDELIDKTIAATNWGFDKTIQLQKALKEKIIV